MNAPKFKIGQRVIINEPKSSWNGWTAIINEYHVYSGRRFCLLNMVGTPQLFSEDNLRLTEPPSISEDAGEPEAGEMPFSAYSRLALRTKSQATGTVMLGLMNKISFIRHSFKLIANDGIYHQMDGQKKQIFYPKSGEHIPSVSDSLGKIVIEKLDSDSASMQAFADLIHGVMGLLTEIPELLAPVETIIQDVELSANDQPTDDSIGTDACVNIAEECGDILWYINLVIDAISRLDGGVANLTLLKMAEGTIAKLYRRYGEKFSSEAANTRDLLSELKTLKQYMADDKVPAFSGVDMAEGMDWSGVQPYPQNRETIDHKKVLSTDSMAQLSMSQSDVQFLNELKEIPTSDPYKLFNLPPEKFDPKPINNQGADTEFELVELEPEPQVDSLQMCSVCQCGYLASALINGICTGCSF